MGEKLHINTDGGREMNILVINGSPKGKRSNTVKLTEAFLAGLNHNSDNEVRRLDVCQMNIGSCKGCFRAGKRLREAA